MRTSTLFSTVWTPATVILAPIWANNDSANVKYLSARIFRFVFPYPHWVVHTAYDEARSPRYVGAMLI